MKHLLTLAAAALVLATITTIGGLVDTAHAAEPEPLRLDAAQLDRVNAGAFADFGDLFSRGATMPIPGGGTVGSFSGGATGGGGVSVTPLPGGWSITSTSFSTGDGGGSAALSFIYRP